MVVVGGLPARQLALNDADFPLQGGDVEALQLIEPVCSLFSGVEVAVEADKVLLPAGEVAQKILGGSVTSLPCDDGEG